MRFNVCSWIGFFSLFGLWSLAGLNGCQAESKGPVKAKRPPAVLVRAILPEDAVITRSYLTTLRADRETSILSKGSGFIVSMALEQGDRVRKGQVVAKIEITEIGDQLVQANAQLAALTVQLDNARQNLARLQKLKENHLASAAEIDNAETAVRVSEAQVKSAEANIDILKTRQGYGEVISPFDGWVIERKLDPGALVGSQGPALYTIGSTNLLRARIIVPQEDLTRVGVGTEVSLSVEGVGEPIKGKIVRISPYLDPSTRTAECEMTFANPDGRLRPGMYGRATADLEQVKQGLWLPPQSVSRRGDVGRLYVLEGNVVHERTVKLGRTLPDGRIEVLEGIAPQARVVVMGRDLIHEGQEVTATEEPAPTGAK